MLIYVLSDLTISMRLFPTVMLVMSLPGGHRPGFVFCYLGMPAVLEGPSFGQLFPPSLCCLPNLLSALLLGSTHYMLIALLLLTVFCGLY